MFVDGLQRATPRSRGVDASGIAAFLDRVEADGLELHDLMIWRDGAVVAEGWRWPYSGERLRMSHSMTKSVTAAAIGLLLEAGQLSLDDPIAPYFPEIPVDPSSPHARMTIAHLITMRTGHAAEVSGSVWRGISTSWVAEFFKIPVVHEPGTVYVYTSAASYMLSAIVSRITGQRLADYLAPRLFEPLGIEGWQWDEGPDGVNPGGNGLSLRTADWLKFAILHVQNGRWEGRQILPESWVKAATRAQADAEYGYHWVVTPTFYAALGQFVQFAMVFPDERAVVVLNAAIKESAAIRPHIDAHFPAVFAGAASETEDALLTRRLAEWSAPPQFVGLPAGDSEAFAGSWQMEPNPLGVTAAALAFDDRGLSLGLTVDGETHAIVAPLNGWRETRATLPGAELHHGYRLEMAPIQAGFRWLAGNRIELVLHYLETAFRDTIVLTREAAGLRLERSVNINSGPAAWPTLTGTRA